MEDDDVKREEEDNVENDDVEEEDRSQDCAACLCEPAQSKCASTFHKSHFTWKFTGKMLGPRVITLIKHRLYTCRKNPSVWTRCLYIYIDIDTCINI